MMGLKFALPLVLVSMACVMSQQPSANRIRCDGELQSCYKTMPPRGEERNAAAKACQDKFYACMKNGQSDNNPSSNTDTEDSNTHEDTSDTEDNNHDQDGQMDY